jgi:hypothetical protein
MLSIEIFERRLYDFFQTVPGYLSTPSLKSNDKKAMLSLFGEPNLFYSPTPLTSQ